MTHLGHVASAVLVSPGVAALPLLSLAGHGTHQGVLQPSGGAGRGLGPGVGADHLLLGLGDSQHGGQVQKELFIA